MTTPIARDHTPDMTITIGTVVADSTVIDTRLFGGGSFHLPATSGTTEITVYAQVGSEAYGIANDEDWSPIAPKAVTAGLPYPLPSVAYNYQRLKLVATGGIATADVPVFMKG
jgi:hypothetical protein